MRKSMMVLLFVSLLAVCTPAVALEEQMLTEEPTAVADEQMADEDQAASDGATAPEGESAPEGQAENQAEADDELFVQSNEVDWTYLDWSSWDGNGALWENDDYNVYRYTISSASKVTFAGTFYMEQVRLELYDANCNRLWYDYYYSNEYRGNIQTSETFDLMRGTYYLMVKKRNDHTGTYTIRVAATTDARETHAEDQGGSNNNLYSASVVSSNASWRGQIAINDDEDWYRVDLASAGSVTFTGTMSMEQVRLELLDAEGNRLWYDYYDWNKNTKCIKISETFDLLRGTYYLKVEKRNNRTGAYAISTKFSNASESIAETQGATNNNELVAASRIARNKVYRGQIAINDGFDWYRFSGVPSGKIRLNGTFAMEQVRLELYDANGSRVWYGYYDWNKNTKTIKVNECLSVGRGTYYLKVEQRNGRTGNYTLRVADLYKNNLTVATTKKAVKYASTKKKTMAVTPFTIKKHAGKVTYAKVSGSSRLSVNKTTGKVSVKKGTKKGTYKIRVKIVAAGDTNHLKGSVQKVATIVVK